MQSKRVDEFIKSLPANLRGAVRLHPLLNMASRGVDVKQLYDELRREHAIIAAAFKAAEMIANDTAMCTHEWTPVVESIAEFYFSDYPKFTRRCKCCPFTEEYIATKKVDTNELSAPIPDWVAETFKGKPPYWAVLTVKQEPIYICHKGISE